MISKPSRYHHLDPDDAFSLRDLWHVLSFRRATIAWITIAIFATTLTVCLVRSPQYVAESDLEINPENASAVDLSTGPADVESEYAVTLATQANVLASDTLALQVIQQLSLEQAEKQRSHLFFSKRADDDSLPLENSPVRRTRMLKQFHKHLSVHVLGGTRILQVRCLDRDPALAATIVNTLVNDYLEQYFQTRYTATRQASEWLSKQLADLKNDVEVSQQRLVDYQRQAGILGESETHNVVTAKLEELNKQLSGAEANRIVKQAVWQLAKTGDPELISSIAGSSFVQGVGTGGNAAQLGLLPALRAQEAQLKADIAQTSARLGPAFPKLQQMNRQLSELQASIALEVGRIASRAQNDYVAAKNAEDMERALFEKQKQEANKLNDSAIQYGILKREVDSSRDLYEGLLGKLKQAGVLAGLRSSNIVVLDPARPSAQPASPDYALNLSLGLLAGLLGGIVCALLKDSFDTAIHTPNDIQRISNLRVLGVIPQVRVEALGSPAVSEQFRALRTAVILSKSDVPARVVLIASAIPHEGKTTVSMNLARVLAQQGNRVLLVDADLRRPSIPGELIGNSGLSNSLTKQDQPCVQDLGDGLHLVVAGPPIPCPAEMLGSSAMNALITGWRQTYEYVVLDTPPVLSVTDAVVLADSADAVLIVVRADSTSGESFLRAQEILEQSRAPVLGAVINGMDFRSPGYAHYYGTTYSLPAVGKDPES